jgi:hypothetical protein
MLRSYRGTLPSVYPPAYADRYVGYRKVYA